MRRIKDFFYNTWLELRLWLYFKGIVNPKRRKQKHWQTLFPTNKSAMMQWKAAMPWGNVHPDYSHQIMTGDSVKEVKTGNGKELFLLHKPYDKPYTWYSGEHKGETVYPTINAGCIHHRKPFLYGEFELTCILPQSAEAWPAFWFYGEDTWPPEIDVFEIMPNTMRKGHFKMSTNIHSGTEGKKNDKTFDFLLRDSRMGKPMTTSCKWTPTYIAWYYEGILVRKVTRRKVMKGMRVPMWLVFGTGVINKDYKKSVYESDFRILSIKYNALSY